jgi:hypothetical protein
VSIRFEQIEQLADRFAAGEDIFKKQIKWIKIKGKRKKKKQIIQLTRDNYIAQEWQVFIRKLPKKINPNFMQKLDQNLHFNTWRNSEVATEWYVLAINSGYDAIRPNIKKFLTKVGRRKYLMPIYTALSKNKADLMWAKSVFDTAKDNYHFVSKSSIESLLYKN